MKKQARILGIGGIFFKTDDPDSMKQWYRQHLGLPTDEHGVMFTFRLDENPREKGYLQWSPFPADTTYFAPSEKPFMINYRVSGIENLVEQLKDAGVEVLDDIATYPYGKFVHLMDPEGNKIELWEPPAGELEEDK